MRRWILGCAVLASSLAVGITTVRAQQQSEDDVRARTHFESGRSYFEEGAYDRAVEEFQRAWDLSRRPPLLINLATTNERLGNYQAAIANIREYVRLVPDDPARTTLERRVENLERLLRERGEGHPESEPSTTEPATPAGGASTNDGLMVGAFAGYGAGAAGALLMGIFGGMALGEDAALRDGCGATVSCTPAQVADADTFALVSDVGLGVALAGVAAGTVLLIMALTSSSGSEARASVAPWLSPEGGGVSTRVRF